MILSVSAATFYKDNKTGVVGLDVKVENILNKLVNLDKVLLENLFQNLSCRLSEHSPHG